MTSFISRKIHARGNVGEVLRQQRELLGLTIGQISRRIAVAERYLQALEEEDWQKLPGEVYVLNFLRRYADELHLDPERVIKQYRQLAGNTVASSIHSLQKTLPLSASHFLILPKVVRNVGVGLVALAFVVYLGVQAMQIIEPPQLVVYTPADNLVTANGQIIVSGVTDPEVDVTVNDVSVPSSNGQFKETVDLQKGLNTIVITASKKYSKPQVVYRKIMWEDNNISKH